MCWWHSNVTLPMNRTPLIADAPISPSVHVGGRSINFITEFLNLDLPAPQEFWWLYSSPTNLFIFLLVNTIALCSGVRMERKNSFSHGSWTHLSAQDKQSLEKEQLSSTRPGLRHLCASSGKLLSFKFTRTFSAMWAGHGDNFRSPGEHNLKLDLLQYGPYHQSR